MPFCLLRRVGLIITRIGLRHLRRPRSNLCGLSSTFFFSFLSLVCSRGRLSGQNFLAIENWGYNFGYVTFPQGYTANWPHRVAKIR